MEGLWYGIVTVVGLVAGMAGAWFLMRPRLARLEEDLRARETELAARTREASEAAAARAAAEARAERVAALEAEAAALAAQRDAAQAEASDLREKAGRLETALTAQQQEVETRLRERNEQAEREKADLKTAFDSEKTTIAEGYEQRMRQEQEAAKTLVDQMKRQFEERRQELQAMVEKLNAELDQMRAQMKETFASVSAEALKQNNEAFLQTATQVFEKHTKESEGQLKQREEAIRGLVKPLDEKLGEYDKFLRELQEKSAEQSGKSEEALKTLLQTIESQRDTTRELKEMLRGPAARGRLGELYLKRLLDEAGLTEGIHYDLQASETVDGVRTRPDCVVRLTTGKILVIDSKTPLNAYEASLEAADEAARLAKLREHAQNLRKHLDDLDKRPYKDLSQPVEMVVMYLPLEASLSAALQVDPEIHTAGWNKGIAVCSPTLLFFLLRMAAMEWRRADVEQNAKQIEKLGREMVNRIRIVADHLARVGGSLGKAVESYNDAQSSLERNLLKQAQRFQRLGVGRDKQVKALPEVDAVPKSFTKPELLTPPDPETRRALEAEEFEEDPIVLDASD